MQRHENLKFAVYYNLLNKHVMIHKIGCNHLYKNGGNHVKKQGGCLFVEKYEAKFFAKSVNKSDPRLVLLNCKFCFKN